MAVRLIVTGNRSVLRHPARPVAKVNDAVRRLLDDMVETMYDAKGVGLAAPQVGVAKRLIVVDAGEKGIWQLVNPCIVEEEGSVVDLEGCLSVPGVYGEVARARRVKVSAMDREGKEVSLEAEGLPARILQHEIDHLNGVLFVDRAVRLVDPEEIKGEGEGRS